MFPARMVIFVFSILFVLPASSKPPVRDSKSKVLLIKDNRIICDKPIDFKNRSAQILPESKIVLASVAATLESHLDISLVEIAVHTDSRGSGAYNKRMTQDRADAIRLELVKMGVKPGRLKAVGYGEAHPIDTNSTVEGRAHNRRVEFVIKSRGK